MLGLVGLFFGMSSNAIAQDALPATETDQAVIIVVGAPGMEEYAPQFAQWAADWQSAAAHTQLTSIGLDGSGDDRSVLQSRLEELALDQKINEVWLVLIGHGTFDGQRAKFNLRGRDIEANELHQWLAPLRQRTVVINCASSSSPFINALSAPDRIIVSATKDGFQYNFARFGQYIAQSINDPAIDLDKDGQTSLLEAFCAANRSVQDFYDQDNRLATELAIIDDNADGRGTPAAWFEGVRAVVKPKEGVADGVAANQVFLQRRGVDAGLTAQQRQRRDQLEATLERIRMRKDELTEEQYLIEIEPVLVELAKIYAG